MTQLGIEPRIPAKPKRWIEQLPLARTRPVLGLVTTCAIVCAAWLLRMITDPLLPSGFPYVTFFPAVIIISFVFGVRLGAVAAIGCGLLAWYFFIPPLHSLVLTHGAGFALVFYVFVVATDLALVHWMQSANRQLAREREVNQALADTRELLFRELQHRVSNNLQVAASLLMMQKRQLADPDAIAALDEASSRLALIGSISRQLYDPSGSAQPLVPFLDELCRSVVDASGRRDVALDLAGDSQLRLEPDAAVPTALIVAETVANALEHGFAGGRPGRIGVEVQRSSIGDLAVTVRNDGRDLPDGFRVEDSTSLGLRIATTLARGLNGSFRLVNDNGVIASLTLPARLLASDV
jgi:two-component sensor histidine kinase